MEWLHNEEPSFTNWVYGEPEMTQSKWPGSTCAFIAKDSEKLEGEWSAQYCRNKASSLCQHEIGQTCPEGWTFHRIQDVGNTQESHQNILR